MKRLFYQSVLFIIYGLISLGDFIIDIASSIVYKIIIVIGNGFWLLYILFRTIWLLLLFFSFLLGKLIRKLNIFRPIKFVFRYRAFVLGFISCLIVFSSYQVYLLMQTLPSPSEIGKINYKLSTHLFDRNGKLLYEVYKDESRTPIKIVELPDYIANAAVAFEDKDYYTHNGIAPISGILRAVRDMVLNKNLQGGSTITQQLVKSSLLSPERTIERKIKEMILAIQTERLFTKKQILELYLNQIPYGGAAYGIEEAAQVYFGKHAKDLKLEEAALLAGLPQSPSVYSPFVNPELALNRRNEVLDRMLEQRYISRDAYNKAKKTKLVVKQPQNVIKAPHFVFYVKKELEKEYGTDLVESGGLNVKTTLDLNIQKESEKILQEELEKIKHLNVTNGAILVTKPATGEILAMVGSVDYFASPSGAFNVVTALRQPGSSIKPIMYSLALERNYTAASILDDSPVAFVLEGEPTYRPVNYDGKFHGKVSLRYALANSYNIPAVRVLQTLGVSQFIAHGKRMGISSWTDPSNYGLSITLGGGEVTMIDMATAMGVLANKGKRMDLTGLKNIVDTSGQSIIFDHPEEIRVLNEGIAYIMSDILSDNLARSWAFGPNSALVVPGYQVAVKTGTTDQKKDNWTIGYNPDFLVAVWVGNNDGTPMHPTLSSGITGAAPIWNRVMKYILDNYSKDKKWFMKPENIIQRPCMYGRQEYFIRGTETNAPCQLNNQTLPFRPRF